MLSFEALYFFEFIDLPFVALVELSGGVGPSLLDLVVQFLGMVIVLVLHVLHVFFVLRNLGLQTPDFRLHSGLLSLRGHLQHFLSRICFLAGALGRPEAFL